MDNVFVRTAADLEKKYNLSKIAKDAGNIEIVNNQIIHLQTELEDTKKAIMINLGDTLQTSVSLWFYEGAPTTLNEPYINWVTPSDHYDDLYYDRDSGYVYKYTSNGWERQYDTNLISALALTNAELDVSTDNERKVYLTQPTPPYSSGDWWILDDGTLMICQIGKLSGTYEENDFVVSTMYTSNIATKQDNTIQVIHGQITQIIEDEGYIRADVAENQRLIGANGEALGELQDRVTTLQTTTSYEIRVVNQRIDNGVPVVSNSLVRIDANGINTSRTGETFNTQITNKTFEVKDGTKELAFIGYDSNLNKTIARISELESRKVTAGNHRCEAIEVNGDKRTAWYFVGGSN